MTPGPPLLSRIARYHSARTQEFLTTAGVHGKEIQQRADRRGFPLGTTRFPATIMLTYRLCATSLYI